MNVRLITSFGFQVLRLSTPLIFAALSAAICEKAGLFNMAAESMMLWGALIGVIVSGATKRVVHYLAKDELVKGALKPVFMGLGIIPVNRRTKDHNALVNAENYLNDEKLIGIFPEGTINRTEDIIMPFKFGAVKMAKDTDTKIVPFAITGEYKPFKKSVKIRFFEPITVGENLEEANVRLMETVSNQVISEGVKQ